MIKVGLTGGIGSGKSTVARFFQERGVSIYYADDEAKKLMTSDKSLISQIRTLLGLEAYIGVELNRPYIASKVFGNHKLLEQLNALVHPAVREDFERWSEQQSSPYVIKEAAVLFENEGYKHCDFTILVTAPKETRIQRVQQRDRVTREQIISRMSAQWEDYQKIALSDCVLNNIELSDTQSKVLKLHTHIVRRIRQGWK